MLGPNPGILAGGSQGKTYADFAAHIATLGGTSLATTASMNASGWSSATRLVTSTVSAAFSGNMWGSPARDFSAPDPTMDAARHDSNFGRFVLHSCVSEAHGAYMVSSKNVFFMRLNRSIYAGFKARDVNLYLSLADANSAQGVTCDRFIYWYLERAWEKNVNTGLVVEYTW